MTTNELKCPVIKSCHACGNYSKKGDWRICNLLDKAVDGSGINYLIERLPDCPFTVEKTAAVQEERERVEGLVEGQLTNAQEGAENYPEGSKAQFASAKLVNTLQWLRDKISEGRIDENSN